MRRIATMAAVTAALLMAPAAASGAETAFVNPANVLTYTSGGGTVDAVTLADGTGSYTGHHIIGETASPSPLIGTGCTGITSSASVCLDATSAFLATLDGNDTLTLDASLPSALWAGDGDDRTTAGPLADWIYGEGGADVLDGRAGFDRIFGGAGNDRIEARDGGADYVDCGDGDDRATVDADDTVVNCESDPVGPAESVTRVDEPVVEPDTDVGGPDPVQKPKRKGPNGPELTPLPLGVDLAPAAGVLSAVATVGADGTAALELACPAIETAGCAGEVFLDPAGAVPAAKAKGKAKAKGHAKAGRAKAKGKPRAMLSRRGRYGRSPFVVAAGKRKKLQVKLTPMARKALGLEPARRGEARAARRGRRVRARVTVIQKGRAARRSVVELRG